MSGDMDLAADLTWDTGSFNQTGSGTNTIGIGANITAPGGISFASVVTLTANVTLDTSSGTGEIILDGGVDGNDAGRNLTLNSGNSGTGAINITGAVGTSGSALGDIDITSSGQVTFSSSSPIDAASYTQIGGSAEFNANQDYTGNFTFDGTDLTVNGAINATGDITVDTTGTTIFNGAVTAASYEQTSGSAVFNTAATQTYTGGGFSFDGTDLTVDGTLGATGDITVDITGTATFGGAVNAASYAQTGTGSAAFSGAQNYSGEFSFTGNVLTLNQNLSAAGDINIVNSGIFTVAAASTVNPGGAMTVAGKTVSLGTINAGPVAEASGPSLLFKDDYDGAAGKLKGNSAQTAFMQFQGAAVKLGEFIHNSNRVVIKGTVDQSLEIKSGFAIGNITIDNPGNTVSAASDIHQSADAELAVRAGTLKLGDSYWCADTAPPPAAGTKGFHGVQGSLVVGAAGSQTSAVLEIGGANPGGGFTSAAGFKVTVESPSAISAAGDADIAGTYRFSAPNTITVSGNVNLTWNVAREELNHSTIVMIGSGKILAGDGNGVKPGNLTIGDTPGGSFTPASITLAENAAIQGSVKIREGSTLDGTGRAITVGGSWIQGPGRGADQQDFPDKKSGEFVYSNSVVTFTGQHIYISGNTGWHDFICESPGAWIYFSTYYDYTDAAFDPEAPANAGLLSTHSVHHLFKVKGGSSAMIHITRQVPAARNTVQDPPLHSTPERGNSTDDPDSSNPADYKERNNRGKFWEFNLVSGAKIEMDNVSVYYSRAIRSISIPSKPKFLVNAAPYYSDQPNYYYNVNWLNLDSFFYSYTEDRDGNGRIDAIRAQAAFELNGDFSGFEVKVDGYEVTGYERVCADPPDPSDPDYQNKINGMYAIYIFLQEKDYADSGAVPAWQVIKNDSLCDLASGSTYTGLEQLDEKIYPVDTAPPRIAYSLALPGWNEVYVRVSEPVERVDGQVPAFSIADGGSEAPARSWQELSPSEFLIVFDDNFTVQDLAGGSKKVILSNLRDKAKRADDQSGSADGSQLPAPCYPLDWRYSGYQTALGADWPAGVLIPANALVSAVHAHEGEASPPLPSEGAPGASAAHRATDLLISAAPASQHDDRWFIWPVWARDEQSAPDFPSIASDDSVSVFYQNKDSDYGLIWEFTGRGILQRRNITLQALRHGKLAAFQAELYYASDKSVPPVYRARRDHGVEGLWLPPLAGLNSSADSYANHEYGNLVPREFNAPKAGTVSAGNSSGTNLFTFSLDKNNYSNLSMLEFYFLLRAPGKTPLYAARLDAPQGAAVPQDWFRRVKPFSFEIHDTTLQRGGVTILNNVINPVKGEKTYINYTLGRPGRVTISVFTLDGTLVAPLVRGGSLGAGEYRAFWDGKNQNRRDVARGMYFIRVVGPDIDEIRKVMVVK
jgi:hypothetical protein